MRDGKTTQTHLTTGLELEHSKDDTAQEYCMDCSTEYEDLLGELDKELIKLGFLTRWWTITRY